MYRRTLLLAVAALACAGCGSTTHAPTKKSAPTKHVVADTCRRFAVPASELAAREAARPSGSPSDSFTDAGQTILLVAGQECIGEHAVRHAVEADGEVVEALPGEAAYTRHVSAPPSATTTTEESVTARNKREVEAARAALREEQTAHTPGEEAQAAEMRKEEEREGR